MIGNLELKESAAKQYDLSSFLNRKSEEYDLEKFIDKYSEKFIEVNADQFSNK